MTYIVDYKEKLLENLEKAQIVAIDTETVSLDDKTMVGFSVAYKNVALYVPVRDEFLDNMSMTKAKDLLNYILENSVVIFHNSSFDLPVLKQFGVTIPDKLYEDTVVMANLVDENTRHGLKKLVKLYFNYEMTELKEVCGSGKSRIGFHEVQDKVKVDYACDDAKYTLRLYKYLVAELRKDHASLMVYTEIEQPLLNVVAAMHINGININVAEVEKISAICKRKIDTAEAKLKALMGDDINFSSTKQLKKYFIDECHLPVLKKSEKTGAASMDKEVLTYYAENNNEAKLLLEFRKYSKIYSTFIPALTPTKWNADTMTGQIHTSFNQAGTVSGRFSSNRPNMQNIPIQDEELQIRKAIIPEPGHIFIDADYGQIELRVLAHFSQDPALLRAYNSGEDIHQQTMDALHVKRIPAKTINFGLVYGMGNKTLAKRIKVSPEEAQHYIDKFFDFYPGVKKFWNETEQQFRAQGYTQTLSGRKRRRSQHFYTKDDYEQGGEVRGAINSVIQGTAADLIKMAMVTMARNLKRYKAKLILTVHDEVLVSCPVRYAKQVYAVITKSMVCAGDDLSVPVEVDAQFGRSWAEAHGDQTPKLKKKLLGLIGN